MSINRRRPGDPRTTSSRFRVMNFCVCGRSVNDKSIELRILVPEQEQRAM
jgi:hypothetical protein